MFALKNKIIVLQGVTNERSIGYSIAQYLARQCEARIILLCQDQKIIDRHNRQLLRETGAAAAYACDVLDPEQIDHAMQQVAEHGPVHGYVHLVAATDPKELRLPLSQVSEKNFTRTMRISCFSFSDMAGKIAPLMAPNGGSMLTLSYIGAQRPVLGYGLIGLAKAALEQSARILAAELGPQGIVVNALSTSPQDSTSGHMIPNHTFIGEHDEAKSFLGHRATYRGIAFAAAAHLDPQWEGTGQIDMIDCGSSVAHTVFPSGRGTMLRAVSRLPDFEEEAMIAAAEGLGLTPGG